MYRVLRCCSFLFLALLPVGVSRGQHSATLPPASPTPDLRWGSCTGFDGSGEFTAHWIENITNHNLDVRWESGGIWAAEMIRRAPLRLSPKESYKGQFSGIYNRRAAK